MKIEWEGYDEHYWPDTDRPWRVTYGLGAFEDFATAIEAWRRMDELRAERRGGWEKLVCEPFNVVERAEL